MGGRRGCCREQGERIGCISTSSASLSFLLTLLLHPEEKHSLLILSSLSFPFLTLSSSMIDSLYPLMPGVIAPAHFLCNSLVR